MDTLNLNSDSSFWFSNCSHIHYGTWQLKDSIYFSSDSVYHKSKKSFVDPQSIANIPPAKYDSNRLYMKVDGKDVSNNPISIIAIFRKTN
ncbi:MAG: hypothetical protein COA58_03965 [Bacteroidetes bacterium]|nr:MAG: hypothetical protein COA58_03965 [Bacteroidota bacterium]